MSVKSSLETTESLFGFPEIKASVEVNSALIFE